MAAITFGGWASDEKIEKYKQQLKAALTAAGITYTNRFYFLGYNPPFEIINRKNEIIVEFEYLQLDQANHLAWGYQSIPPFTTSLAYVLK